MESCCILRRQLAEAFATAARLHAEAVVLLTRNSIDPRDYIHLVDLALKAQERAEAAGIAFEEHIRIHKCVWEIRTPRDRGVPLQETLVPDASKVSDTSEFKLPRHSRRHAG
jgi:hypothetical protein